MFREIDCNLNQLDDACDIASGYSLDDNGNGIPDECETDCNGNRILDSCEIDWGTSQDLNGNGVPDECECPGDCGDNNGNVGIVDFLALLAEWGQVGTPCDLDGGGVGITDFLALLANWGPCP